MKFSIKDGGFAFPSVGFSSGMTLRDYFAGQALAQLIKREVREIRRDGRKMDCFGLEDSQEVPWHTSHIASESYAIADAMLAARERKEDAK